MIAISPWALAAIVPCRACGGRLFWAEFGYVPDYRVCEGCGRTWMVDIRSGRDRYETTIAISIPENLNGPDWAWDKPDTSDEAYQEYVRLVEQFEGEPASKELWVSHPIGVWHMCRAERAVGWNNLKPTAEQKVMLAARVGKTLVFHGLTNYPANNPPLGNAVQFSGGCVEVPYIVGRRRRYRGSRCLMAA